MTSLYSLLQLKVHNISSYSDLFKICHLLHHLRDAFINVEPTLKVLMKKSWIFTCHMSPTFKSNMFIANILVQRRGRNVKEFSGWHYRKHAGMSLKHLYDPFHSLPFSMTQPPQAATVSMNTFLPTKMVEKAKTWWIWEQSAKAWNVSNSCWTAVSQGQFLMHPS